MKYIAPEFATIVVDAEDIILASIEEGEGGSGENVGGPDYEL